MSEPGGSARRDRGGWTEGDSKTFVEAADLFVPDREEQIDVLCRLALADSSRPRVLELCCGDGRLAEALLERGAGELVALDGSEAMLELARSRLAAHGDRVDLRLFDLASRPWRGSLGRFSAVVSSLALHHLDGPAKRTLFADLAKLLEPGGRLLIADLVQPTTNAAVEYAADAWEREVERRSQERTGSDEGLERFRALGWNHYRDPDPDDLPSPLFDQLRWLRDAGLDGPDVFWMKAGHALFGAFKPG